MKKPQIAYTRAQQLQILFIRSLDAVRDMLPSVQALAPAERDGWTDEDLAALGWMLDQVGERLVQHMPPSASLTREAVRGTPWAKAMLLKRAGKPVPRSLRREVIAWTPERTAPPVE